MFNNPNMSALKQILMNTKTIAVVGLSDNPERTSYQIAERMQRIGYRILPVNPQIQNVLGETAYASLQDISISVDMINVFRRSDALLGVVEDAVSTNAPVIWAQQGVYDEEAADLATKHGKTMIMDLCVAVMYARLMNQNEH
jgi:uncharacterized protein